ncbi:MAG: hypothetical protein DRN26_01990 [Thermoplasmata archaeon]|nr:MAG: hypothetical protein DRN26_01990 [Thermoplasmata archaeon]
MGTTFRADIVVSNSAENWANISVGDYTIWYSPKLDYYTIIHSTESTDEYKVINQEGGLLGIFPTLSKAMTAAALQHGLDELLDNDCDRRTE